MARVEGDDLCPGSFSVIAETPLQNKAMIVAMYLAGLAAGCENPFDWPNPFCDLSWEQALNTCRLLEADARILGASYN